MAAQAQALRHLAQIVLAICQRLLYQRALELRRGVVVAGAGSRAAGRYRSADLPQNPRRQVFAADRVPIFQQAQALQQVLLLAYVAGPLVGAKDGFHLGG